jgi:DNA-binding winged helix-turn-helix (wHTH) protein
VKAFQVGEWRVHPSLNRLTRGAEEVRVEPKVMQVLEALAETPGDVITRDRLVEKVWPGVFVSDDVVHRAIRELRRAFGDETTNPAYVETIRKRGYRLIAPVTPLAVDATAAIVPPPMPSTDGMRISRVFVAAATMLAVMAVAVVYALASRRRRLHQRHQACASLR